MYVWHNLYTYTILNACCFLLWFSSRFCFQSNLVSVTQMQIAHICTHLAVIRCVSHNLSVYHILLKMFSRFLPFFSHIGFVILLNCPHSLTHRSPIHCSLGIDLLWLYTFSQLHNRISWHYYIHLTIKLINWRYLGGSRFYGLKSMAF